MKYRIRKEGERFYPECKNYLFWTGWMTTHNGPLLYMDTEKEALDYITEKKNKSKTPVSYIYPDE
tara:strand:+ start:72413 stop:72607 length:195 start_codon:yes stop_codon:yes gene_type:complete